MTPKPESVSGLRERADKWLKEKGWQILNHPRQIGNEWEVEVTPGLLAAFAESLALPQAGINFTEAGLDICREIVRREYEKNPENFREALRLIGMENVLPQAGPVCPTDLIPHCPKCKSVAVLFRRSRICCGEDECDFITDREGCDLRQFFPAPPSSLQPYWQCFNCEFRTTDRAEAEAHFGDRDEEGPLCRIWSELNADGRLQEYQSTLRELTASRDEEVRTLEALAEANRKVGVNLDTGLKYLNALKEAEEDISDALKYAGNRWPEWGNRAEHVQAILEEALAEIQKVTTAPASSPGDTKAGSK